MPYRIPDHIAHYVVNRRVDGRADDVAPRRLPLRHRILALDAALATYRSQLAYRTPASMETPSSSILAA